MISVCDLMQGNMVKTSRGIVKVCESRRGYIQDKWGECYFEDEIEGIEVTHELLEANGFKEDTCYWKMHIDEHNIAQYYFHESRLEKFWYGKDEWQNNTWIREVAFSANGLRYLHQLQQACRMCGIKIDWKV